VARCQPTSRTRIRSHIFDAWCSVKIQQLRKTPTHALRLVERTGFRSVSMEAIAAEVHVARTTIYRRWPNKATLIMDAFLAEVGPGIAFPELPSALESLRMQMKLLARAYLPISKS
jgi:tetracycline repressor-like protein